MVEIYGSVRSSAGRCYLMLEECGVPYKEKPLDMMNKREHKGPEFLKINPNGKVPCLIDGDFILWESAAIVQYLAEKYKPELLGKTAEEKGHVSQWMFWGMLEMQPPIVDILIQKFFVPDDKKDAALVEKRMQQIPSYLEILNHSLKGKKYLAANHYTIADLVVASVVNTSLGIGLDIKGYSELNKWFSMIQERPAFQKFMEMRKPRN